MTHLFKELILANLTTGLKCSRPVSFDFILKVPIATASNPWLTLVDIINQKYKNLTFNDGHSKGAPPSQGILSYQFY